MSTLTYSVTSRILRPLHLHWYPAVRLSTVAELFNERFTLQVKQKIEEKYKSVISGSGQTSALKSEAEEKHIGNKKDNFYVLSMFPYPSGSLHMGHVRVYTISDTLARFYTLKGKKVFQPMGWDAFGLPAENAAIENKVDPAAWTLSNIGTMREQLNSFGAQFDWAAELATSDPRYYKWTQALFLDLYHAGLVYRKEALVNWDPVDNTVLADEQVDENGVSWRSGAQVEKRCLSQWFVRTTRLAKDLYEGLSDPILEDWKDIINLQQHWIGEPNGITFEFPVLSAKQEANDFKAKTVNLWISDEEIKNITKSRGQFIAVKSSHMLAKNEPDHSGVVGLIRNAFTEVPIPAVVCDSISYPPWRDIRLCLAESSNEEKNLAMSSGILEVIDAQVTKIVPLMRVVRALDLPVVRLGKANGVSVQRPTTGLIVDLEDYMAKKLSHRSVESWSRDQICSFALEKDIGGFPVSSKLRDWLISRQRYWGTPIPIVHCPTCGPVPVPLSQLPVTLPPSPPMPLIHNEDWQKTECPQCGDSARRETDTMDTFVDSSWYYVRYLDKNNTKEAVNSSKTKEWLPVDLYIGGSKKPGNAGTVFSRHTNDPVMSSWEKMSKSKHNGVNPGTLISEYGIDTTRLFVLSDVAPTSEKHWSDAAFPGILNWQVKLWLLFHDFLKYKRSPDLVKQVLSLSQMETVEKKLRDDRNKAVRNVSFAYDRNQQLNAAICRLQSFTTSLRNVSPGVMASSDLYVTYVQELLIMLAPMTPHLASFLWDVAEFSGPGLWNRAWPQVDSYYPLTFRVMMYKKSILDINKPKHELIKMDKSSAIDLLVKQIESNQKLKFYKYFLEDNALGENIEQIQFSLDPNNDAILTLPPSMMYTKPEESNSEAEVKKDPDSKESMAQR